MIQNRACIQGLYLQDTLSLLMENFPSSAWSSPPPSPHQTYCWMSVQRLIICTEFFPPLEFFFPFSAFNVSPWKVMLWENFDSKVQSQQLWKWKAIAEYKTAQQASGQSLKTHAITGKQILSTELSLRICTGGAIRFCLVWNEAFMINQFIKLLIYDINFSTSLSPKGE